MFAYMKVLFTCTASTASPHIQKAINMAVTTFQPNQIGGKKDFFSQQSNFLRIFIISICIYMKERASKIPFNTLSVNRGQNQLLSIIINSKSTYFQKSAFLLQPSFQPYTLPRPPRKHISSLPLLQNFQALTAFIHERRQFQESSTFDTRPNLYNIQTGS